MKWRCYCGYEVEKDTPQGLGMAKHNHLRKHKKVMSFVNMLLGERKEQELKRQEGGLKDE